MVIPQAVLIAIFVVIFVVNSWAGTCGDIYSDIYSEFYHTKHYKYKEFSPHLSTVGIDIYW